MPIKFRMRSEQRDHRNDSLRLARLLGALDEMEVGLNKEHKGLKRRYESAAMAAAFAQQYIEDEETTEKLSAEIEDMTETLRKYRRRMDILEQQIALVEQLRATTEDFADDLGFGREAGRAASHARH